MRIAGKTIQGPSREVLVIPRATGDIVFEAEAVLDFSEFEQVAPQPKPPQTMIPGGIPVPNFDHPEYKASLRKWSEKRTNWMILKSLSATKDLEWDMVKMEQPDTWELLEKELELAGFNQMEQMLIRGLGVKVNSVDEEKMEQARKRFLALQPSPNGN
jgi:hypothetical protein